MAIESKQMNVCMTTLQKYLLTLDQEVFNISNIQQSLRIFPSLFSPPTIKT